MKSVFAVTLLVAATVSASPSIPHLLKDTIKRFSHSKSQLRGTTNSKVGDWPVVNLFDNFYIECVVNQWDPTDKKFNQYKNMTMTQAIDSDGNRELTHMFSDIDGIGYVDVQTFADFSTQLIHQKIPAVSIC